MAQAGTPLDGTRPEPYRRLIDHLRIARDDETAWTVLGDMLAAAGHPRGELVNLERQLTLAEGTPRHREILLARAELFSRHRDQLLGPRAVLSRHALTWRSGFVLEASVSRFGSHHDWVSALRTHESCTLLRELRVGAWLLEGYLVQRGSPLTSLVLGEPRIGRYTGVMLTESKPTAGPRSPGLEPETERIEVNEFSSYFPSLTKLTFEDYVRVSVEGLRPPCLEDLVIAPKAEVVGLSTLMAHRRLKRLVLQDRLEYARELTPETAPVCVALEGTIALESGWLMRLGTLGVTTLDLEGCKLDTRGVNELACGLKNVRGPLKVKLSRAMRRNERVKAALAR